MYGNKLIPVKWKACVPHCKLVPQRTMCTMASVNIIPYQRAFGKICMIRVKWTLEYTNQNINFQMFPEVLK